MNTEPDATPPIACDLTAIPDQAREGHLLTTTQIFQAVQAIYEKPDGYTLRLPNEEGMWLSLARFVENERRCCPFFRFGLEVEPDGGPLWLRLAGAEGVKDLLQTLLAGQVDPARLQQLIQTGGDPGLEARVAETVPAISGAFKKASRG
jgi:hypothetical protein